MIPRSRSVVIASFLSQRCSGAESLNRASLKENSLRLHQCDFSSFSSLKMSSLCPDWSWWRHRSDEWNSWAKRFMSRKIFRATIKQKILLISHSRVAACISLDFCRSIICSWLVPKRETNKTKNISASIRFWIRGNLAGEEAKIIAKVASKTPRDSALARSGWWHDSQIKSESNLASSLGNTRILGRASKNAEHLKRF